MRIEELLARSAYYHGLSLVLRHPDAQTAKWLAMREHHRLPEIAALLAGHGSALAAQTQRLVSALDATAIRAWAQHYERLFGHSVQSAAPPYELEYGEEHSHRQPQELADIAAFYQAFGLQVSADAHERVDHAATECEFMEYVLYKQAAALDEGRPEQAGLCEAAARQFLADHWGCWGVAFASRLLRFAGCAPLESAASVVLEWLKLECARLQVREGQIDLPLRAPKEQDDIGCAACASHPSREASGE